MEGKKCEDCSRIGEGYVASADSALMKRFRKSGVIALGRTKTPEFGFAPTTELVFPGPARNPWNPEHSTGGSSGGAGGVVGARVAPIAHASDGGGSIRIPAAACGVVGLKASRGRVSAGPINDEPLFGMATEFILSRSVRDSALMLDLVQGAELGDPYEISGPSRPYAEEPGRSVGALKIGFMPHPMGTTRSTGEVLSAAEAVEKLCADLGHNVEIAMPDIGMEWDTFVHMEAAAWCIGLHTWINALGAETGRLPSEDVIQLETYAAYMYGKHQTADDLVQALALRNISTRSFAAFFRKYDILLSPVLPSLPLPLRTFSSGWGKTGLEWTRYVFDRCPFTPIFNVSGPPAISLPLGHDMATDLPIGIQFGAAFGREDLLLRLAGQLEAAQPWIGRMPAVTRGLF